MLEGNNHLRPISWKIGSNPCFYWRDCKDTLWSMAMHIHYTPESTNMTMENHQNLIGDTSSTGCFVHFHVKLFFKMHTAPLKKNEGFQLLKVSVKQNHGISHNGTRVARNQIEPRKKPLLYYFPLYWLVNRGPYNGLIPIYLGSIIPLYNPTNQGFFHCSILTPMFWSKLSGRVFSFSLFHAASAVDGVRRPLSRFGLGPVWGYGP